MGVEVDQARCDDRAARVDDLATSGSKPPSDIGDHAIFERDIRGLVALNSGIDEACSPEEIAVAHDATSSLTSRVPPSMR
jgi:hypothetical protein